MTTRHQVIGAARSWASRFWVRDALDGQRGAWNARHVRRLGVLMAFGVVGAGFLVRGARRLGLRRLTGVGAGRRAVDVEDGIEVNAPLDRVFDYWERFDNFPKFMPSVLEVRDLGNCRSHWKVIGPLGRTVEWDAEQTVEKPSRLIGWKTIGNVHVEHAGIVRFEPFGTDRTRVSVRLSYNPPGGVLGHGVASLLGVGPRWHMRADLPRMKQAVESGLRPA